MSTSKKKRLSNLKEILQALVSEDPLLAGIFVVVYIPLATRLIPAMLEDDLQLIFFLIAGFSSVTIFVSIPLIITKHKRAADKARIEDEMKKRASEYQMTLEIERNKQNKFNQLMDAKIESIKTETAIIVDSMEQQTTNMMIETIQRLSDSFRGDISSENYLRANEYKEAIKEIIEKVKQQTPRYDNLFDKIEKLDFSNIEIESKDEEIDLSSETITSKPKSVKVGKLCPHCAHHNPPKQIRCKKCKKSCQS